MRATGDRSRCHVAGGQVCYEPIVFRDSLRIETENIADTWHLYQYSYRIFPSGTDLTSYDGTLGAEEQTARLGTLASGIYFARLRAGDLVQTRKLVIAR